MSREERGHTVSRLRVCCRDLVHGEAGMMSISNSILLLGATLLLTANYNMSAVVARKIEVQNAADASAQTAGIWMARGMNAVTATNHLMGEMLSFVVLHEALGGKKHERNISADDGPNRSKTDGGETMVAPPSVLKRRDQQLKAAYRAADGMKGVLKFPPHADVFNLVHERENGRTGIHAEATMLDAKLNLKNWLARIYLGKALAGALISTGIKPLVAVGRALELVIEALERKVQQEYLTLQALHVAATKLMPVKELLRDVLLPAAKRYTTAVVRSTAATATHAAQQVARLNNAAADVFPRPGQLRLPVQMDPLALAQTVPVSSRVVPEPRPSGCGCPSEKTAVSRDQLVKVTQLARATFPWVNYHRQPLLDAMAATLQLAKARDLYFDWTNGYCKTIADEQQQGTAADPDGHLGLYVVEGYTGPDKGYELWNLAEYSPVADDLFSMVALARMDSATMVGRPLFSQEHPEGQAAWAMVMLYNGNEQQRPEHRIDLTCKRIMPIRQANTGMDTLNWKPGSLQKQRGCEERPSGSAAGENRPFELLGIGLPADYPAIQVNWQARLVPTTTHRLNQLRGAGLPAPFSRILQRIPSDFPTALTTH